MNNLKLQSSTVIQIEGISQMSLKHFLQTLNTSKNNQICINYLKGHFLYSVECPMHRNVIFIVKISFKY